MKTNWIQRDIIKLNAKILAPLWKNYIKTDMEKLKQIKKNIKTKMETNWQQIRK